MTVNHIVVHKILKNETQQRPVIDFSDEELSIQNDDVLEFGAALAKTYFDKKSRFYTIYKIAEDIEPVFKQKTDEYLEHDEFYRYTRQVTEILHEKMDETPSSRGGFVVTMDYSSSSSNRYLFVALLNNKEDFSINDSLEIIKNLTLNIDKMAMASVINISRYTDGQDNYITFLRGLRDIPDYFISFIGANKDRKKDIREVTKSWLDAIEQFYENKELSAESIEDRAKSIITQIKNLNRNEEIITAEILANIIYPEDPENFIEFAFNEDNSFELPSEMDRLDTQVLNELSIVSYSNKAKGFTLKFKRKDIGTLINYDNDRIIINDREIVEAIQRVVENE